MQSSIGELEAAKKNLDEELKKEQTEPKETEILSKGPKAKLKIARKVAKELKNSESMQEIIDRQMHSLDEITQILNQPRETATFGQLVNIVIISSLRRSLNLIISKLNDTSNATSSQRKLIENKWLKRWISGPPFRFLRSQDSSILKDTESQAIGTSIKPLKELDKSQQDNLNDSTPPLKPLNILEEVTSNQLPTSKSKTDRILRSSSKEKKSQGFRSLENSPLEVTNNLKSKFEESKPDSSTPSRRKSRNATRKTTPKPVTRKSEAQSLTPKTRKSSVSSAVSRNSFTPQNKSMAIESDIFQKELDACKSKLRKTQLEKETIENRLKHELEEKRNENYCLLAELNKLKAELQKCINDISIAILLKIYLLISRAIQKEIA